jgi:hypothetical protein
VPAAAPVAARLAALLLLLLLLRPGDEDAVAVGASRVNRSCVVFMSQTPRALLPEMR